MTDNTNHDTGGGSRPSLPLNEWYHRIMQRKALILIPMVVTFLVCAAVILSMRPQYSARATVMIEGQINKVLEAEDVAARVRDTTDALASEIQVLESAAVARAVIERLDLRNHPQFMAPPEEEKGPVMEMVGNAIGEAKAFVKAQIDHFAPPDDAPAVTAAAAPGVQQAVLRTGDEGLVNAFRARLSIKPVGESRVLAVSFTADTPELAAQAANAVAEEYLAMRSNLKVQVAGEAAEWLKDRVDELRQEVRLAEARVEAFRSERGLMDKELVGTRVKDLNALILSAQAQYQMQLEREQSVKDMLRSNGPVALVERISLPDLRGGAVQGGLDQTVVPTLQDLRLRVTEARQVERDLSGTYGSRHPALVEARNVRRAAEAALASEVGAYIRSLEAKTRMAERHVRKLEESMANLEDDTMRSEDQAVQLVNLERDAEINKTLYEDAVSRYRQIQNLAMGRADAWIVSQALVPGAPSSPKTKELFAVAAIFSLGVGLAIFAVREMAAGGINDATQIPLLFGARHLSTVPLAKTGLFRRSPPVDFVLDKPQAAFSEGLNTLAVSLNLFAVQERGRVVCMTSCREGEGKSLMTLSLARLVAAQTGQRVLAIECDLRKRTMGRYMRSSGPGLGEYLDNKRAISECTYHDPRSTAHFMFAGRSSRSPQNILSSRGFQELLERSREVYDLVLIDTPPLIEVSDTRLITKQVDDAVLLVKWRSTPRAAVARAVEQLRDQDEVFAGIALTQVDLRRYREYSMNSTFSYSGRYYEA